MTVKELIQQLEVFPQEYPIEIEPCLEKHETGCCFYYIDPYLDIKAKKVYL